MTIDQFIKKLCKERSMHFGSCPAVCDQKFVTTIKLDRVNGAYILHIADTDIPTTLSNVLKDALELTSIQSDKYEPAIPIRAFDGTNYYNISDINTTYNIVSILLYKQL